MTSEQVPLTRKGITLCPYIQPLKAVNHVLARHKLSKQDELNSLTSIKEVKFVLRNLPTMTTQVPGALTEGFSQMLKEKAHHQPMAKNREQICIQRMFTLSVLRELVRAFKGTPYTGKSGNIKKTGEFPGGLVG